MGATLGWGGWIVIALYLAGMVGIGYYYMRRNESTDDFLLGGRTMKSRLVGLSLFATLLSTISYLAYPGEIIKHGPLFMGMIVAMPFVYFIVGWFIIPPIMKLKATSAYEIIETRFNGSLRILGSLIFLILRLFWMSVIIYATTDKVIIPILGLSEDMAPLLCSILGIITLVYTSMGGIRAVVLTDAIQSFILLGGALLALVIITIKLGGISPWWPDQWADHWDVPEWGFQISRERTLGWFVLAPLIWYICTNGSDQMSIQRFLSTRDAKAARSVLGTSLLAGIIVTLILCVLGFALIGYFSAETDSLKSGQFLYENADQLFTWFIVTSLPDWVSGILIAGLMAAAMSSLSSGMNSSSAVITEDILTKVRRKNISGRNRLRLVKVVSAGVGLLTVIMSLFVYIVPGNLLEITYRVSNLFTAPLFIMFFMAIFIPWATVFGTWVGTLCSAGVAVLIAFWDVFFISEGPSFLYIMPASLLVGILAGTIASLLPVGPGPKPMIAKY